MDRVSLARSVQPHKHNFIGVSLAQGGQPHTNTILSVRLAMDASRTSTSMTTSLIGSAR